MESVIRASFPFTLIWTDHTTRDFRKRVNKVHGKEVAAVLAPFTEGTRMKKNRYKEAALILLTVLTVNVNT